VQAGGCGLPTERDPPTALQLSSQLKPGHGVRRNKPAHPGKLAFMGRAGSRALLMLVLGLDYPVMEMVGSLRKTANPAVLERAERPL
jgi:hypothetical protein